MFEHRLEHPASRTVVWGWFLLSFNGGFINAGGFLATGRFVSHVTGFATLFGVDLVRFGWKEALGILSVPFFFLGGAFMAGLLIDRQIFKKRAPHYDYVMGLSSIALIIAASAGSFNSFGVFGHQYHVGEVYLLLVTLCFACGLQNAAITSSSGSSVRTTHLTGLTTDLGLGLARLCTFKTNDERLRIEYRSNSLRARTLLFFVIGSAAGAIVFYNFHYSGFFIPAFISALAAWRGRQMKMRPHNLRPANP